MQITTQPKMLNGAPNRRGKPSVKISVLHNNTSVIAATSAQLQ